MEQLTLSYAAEAHANGWMIPTNGALKGAFKAGAEWQKEQTNWISVKDRLLGILKYVLVYNTEGAVLVARLFAHDWVAIFSDGEKEMGELTATHWQPLPPPPFKPLQD